MTEHELVIKTQSKLRKEKTKELSKILQDTLHKINKINDDNYSITGIKEGVRSKLHALIQSLR